ncbi:MAG: hypothetical protein J6K03_05855 [Oscillospiraceae bacterium]|nr:hypothetical protein [Oscillospiraceae bacterium]
MNSQFYVLIDQNTEQELLQFVRQECTLTILPALITDAETPYISDYNKSLFVTATNKDHFWYSPQESFPTPGTKAIQARDRETPYIEYSCEKRAEQTIIRFYLASKGLKEEIKPLKSAFEKIRAWISSHCSTKKKEGLIWVYYLKSTRK